jgi:hypothetical protein
MTMAKKDRDQISALAAEGYSAGEVADRLGLSRNAVLGEAHRAGIKFGGARDPQPPVQAGPSSRKPYTLQKPVTTAQLAEACKWMRQRGATYSEIGKIFDRTPVYILKLVSGCEPVTKAPQVTASPAPKPAAPRAAISQPSKWLQYAQQVAAGVEPEAWPA